MLLFGYFWQENCKIEFLARRVGTTQFPDFLILSQSQQLLEAIVLQLFIAYSVNALLVVIALSELSQFFSYFLHVIV